MKVKLKHIRIKRTSNDNIKEKEEPIKKSEDRIKVLKKIEELEKEGKFDIDVEEDPPTIVLTPENIDLK